MFLKGAFKDSSFFVQLVMFFAILTLGVIVSVFISSLFLVFKFGFSIEVINEVQQNLINYPDVLRNMQFFQVIALFIFPAIICAWLFSDNYKSYLQVDTPVSPSIIVLTILSTIVAVPFLNWTYIINQQLVLPDWLKGLEDWMIQMEEANAVVMEKMLSVDTVWKLLFNIVIICILTGIGEEFIFRGVLQKIVGKIIRNPYIIIWTVAILFSAVHFRFYGFIPRLLLGAYFGYLLLYTKSIWIPALAHFTYNLIGVYTYYIFQNSPDLITETDNIGTGETWWLSIVSFALFIFLAWQIKKRSQLQNLFS